MPGTKTLIRKLPGLWAQNPSAVDDDDFLGRLEKFGEVPSAVAYGAVGANYQPGGDQNVMQMLSECAENDKDRDKYEVNTLWRCTQSFHNGHMIIMAQTVTLRSERNGNTSEHHTEQTA